MKRISLLLLVLAILSVAGFSVGHSMQQQARGTFLSGTFQHLGANQTGHFLDVSAAAGPSVSPLASVACLPSSQVRGEGRPAKTLSSLALAARASISAALGRDIADYQIRAQKGGVQAANAQHKLAAEFTSAGVAVRSGSGSFGMALFGYGYGDDLEPTPAVLPTASFNRLEYRRGPLTEWYVNGPLGLEQGFTLAEPPRRADGQPLQIALALSGNLTATVDEGKKSLRLTGCDKRAAMQYAGLTATDANGKELPAWLELREGSPRGEQLLIKVADSTARYPIVVDPVMQLAKLTASDGVARADLGRSVSVSGNTVVVGAEGATVGLNRMQGAAYVFVKPVSGWANMTQTAKLTASDGAGGDNLGVSVSISGNTVVAGAFDAKIGSKHNQGAAYVFVKPAGGWADMTQTAKLTASDGAAGNEFGFSASASGNTVLAGAPLAKIGSNLAQGAAYVFVMPASGWTDMTQTAKLTASDGGAGNDFGFSTSVSGNAVVVGAPFGKRGTSSNQGAAYVFVKAAGGWVNMTQTAELTASDSMGGDLLGSSAAISGNTAVLGASGKNQNQGAAYVFVRPASGWVNGTQTAKLTASDGLSENDFGTSISIGGNRVVAGAPFAGGPNGKAYVFVKPASGWANMTQTAELNASGGAAGEEFGSSVSVSGNTVLAGAPLGDAAYVFGP
jgi:trimeric autotransporter adhesin